MKKRTLLSVFTHGALSAAKRKMHERVASVSSWNERLSTSQVCADYPSIISGLSAPGKTASIRGYAYSIEGAIAIDQ